MINDLETDISRPLALIKDSLRPSLKCEFLEPTNEHEEVFHIDPQLHS